MNSTKEYKDPRERSFSDEIHALDTDVLRERYNDIELYLDEGIRPSWTVILKPSSSLLDLKFWVPEDIVNYRRILMMELLDRCKSFELIPEIKFNF